MASFRVDFMERGVFTLSQVFQFRLCLICVVVGAKSAVHIVALTRGVSQLGNAECYRCEQVKLGKYRLTRH